MSPAAPSADATDIAGALAWARARIDQMDARVLLRHVLQCPAARLVAWPEQTLATEDWAEYRALVERRAAGEPVAYLTGAREFYSRAFRVGNGVLIPRPETEQLVGAALDSVRGRDGIRVLDLGTGSGIVAITLALELGSRAASVVAVDRSATALGYASMNAGALGAAVDFRLGDWFAGLDDLSFDLIAANPPYVADSDPHLACGDLRFEPIQALAGGDDGLDAIRDIVAGAGARLSAGASLLIEHGHDQASEVRRMLAAAGFALVRSVRDLAGIERVTTGRWCVDGIRRRAVD